MKVTKITTTITLNYEYTETFEGDEIGMAAEIEGAIIDLLELEGLDRYPNKVKVRHSKEVFDV